MRAVVMSGENLPSLLISLTLVFSAFARFTLT